MRERIPRCLFLDIGHVLIDLDYHGFGARMKALTGLSLDRLRAAISGDDLAPRYETGRLSDELFHREVCRRIGIELPWEDFARTWNSILVPTPIIPEKAIKALADRVVLWAVSNTNPLHFAHIRRSFPLMRHFRGYSLSYEVGALKPDPRIYLHALAGAAAEPGDALFVDDRPDNVTAAASLGIPAFQFLDRDQFFSELEIRGLLD